MPKTSDDSSPRAGRTRILNACQRCRKKKVKCSGEAPCVGCTETFSECLFDESKKKIMVPERDFLDLVSTVNRYKQVPLSLTKNLYATSASTGWDLPALAPARQTPPTVDPASFPPANVPTILSVPTPIEDTIPAMLNPLTSSESFLFVDTSGKQRYLGSSSSISFSWQIRCFLKRIVGDQVSINLHPRAEEHTYTMASISVRDALNSPANDDLPSKQYAKYLAETTLFHLGEVYHVFERELFMANLDRFYDVDANAGHLHSLWHVQLLLVIAFGKMFLRRGASALGPPGAPEFLRAMRLHSDWLDVWSDPILRLEIFCLIALYLNTADMRASAHMFIGQAMRLALSLGMNRAMPPGYIDDTEYSRRRRVWWTLYIIDRKLSVIMGAPLSIQDDSMDVPKPNELDLGFSNAAFSLHVELAELEGNVISAAYRINSAVDEAFIKRVQDVFSSMNKLAEKFRGQLSLGLSNTSWSSLQLIPETQVTPFLCTIISTRPILFVLVKQRLAPLLEGLPVVEKVSDSVLALLNTCAGAATSIISVLSALHEQDLVEPFLPMDLQAIFSAGFILSLTSIAYPSLAVDEGCIAKADEILSWMCSKGNSPAASRRQDLAELRAAAVHINSSQRQPTLDLDELFASQSRSWDAITAAGGILNQNIGASTGILDENDAFWARLLEEVGTGWPDA